MTDEDTPTGMDRTLTVIEGVHDWAAVHGVQWFADLRAVVDDTAEAHVDRFVAGTGDAVFALLDIASRDGYLGYLDDAEQAMLIALAGRIARRVPLSESPAIAAVQTRLAAYTASLESMHRPFSAPQLVCGGGDGCLRLAVVGVLTVAQAEIPMCDDDAVSACRRGGRIITSWSHDPDVPVHIERLARR